MNYYILPRFGNVPIDQITYLNIEEFISGLKCTNKRINNIMVPMRSMMKFALKASLIDRNPMDLVDNLKVSNQSVRQWLHHNLILAKKICHLKSAPRVTVQTIQIKI